MKKVTGLGGIFFKCKDPQKMMEWYSKNLGINTDEYGTSFVWNRADKTNSKGYTAWSPFREDTDYIEPSRKDFMINYRVDHLEALLQELSKEGIEQVGEIQIFEYGKFAHIMDPEGNKIELWEPNDSEYEKILEKTTPEL